jgi:hypothetical protein
MRRNNRRDEDGKESTVEKAQGLKGEPKRRKA